MEKIFNAAKIFVTGIFLVGILFIGGKASAEEVNQEAMQIFRETVAQTSKYDDRVYHQDILFLMPQLTGELEFFGAIEKEQLTVRGFFFLWNVDENGNDTKVEKPFYLTQDNQNMVVYFTDEKNKWNKMTSPVSAANMVDMISTPNAAQLEKMIGLVKNVDVLRESDKSRTLLIKIDGVKFWEDMKAEMAQDPEVQKQQENEISKAIFGYFEEGFKNADMWIMWTVDKTKWQTTNMSFNFSSLLQNIATAALNDPTNSFVNMDPIREMLESVAYYSELKGYVTFLNPAAKDKLALPKNVLKAKEVKSFNVSTEDSKSKKK